MTSPGVSLNHIALSVTDKSRATRFYVEVLGLKELPRPDFGIPGAWLSAGAAMIHLAEVPAIPEPRDSFAHFALAVATEQVSAVAEAVRRGGGTVLSEPATSDHLGKPVTSAFCRDTEGNRFELTDAGLG
jgi:catechol 2,3-dioxygenase-like lactoylglutathione lyase family enzyme